MGTRRFHPITVVGAWDGKEYRALVRGKDLEASSIGELFKDATMIVTFNGASFDLPMIRAHYPDAVPDVPHLDLKHLLTRLGNTGGLKQIERRMGLERDLRLQYLTGQDAVYLWRLWDRQGRWNALEVLKEYNTEDCVNLKTIADRACAEMRRSVTSPFDMPGKD